MIQKHIIKIFLTVFLAIGYFFVTVGENTKETGNGKSEQKSDLARIAILNFDDKTGTKDYEYMSGSLGDAVDASMQKNFTYERVNPADVEKVIYNVQQKLQKEKIEKKIDKKADERLGFLKILAKELSVDIVIFGRYDFEQTAQMMNIYTNVYYVAINEIADLPVVANKVDSTIFGATDKAAANIITEIQKMAQQATQKSEAEKAKSEKEDNKTIVETKTGEPAQKIVLTKKMAKSYIRFVDNKNATITDNFTKLIWQKCTMGQNNNPSCTGVKKANNWDDTVKYCSSLSLGDKTWRLPTAEELETITDKRERPAVKVVFAPYTDVDVNFLGYWSSSENADNADSAMTMSFRDGALTERSKNARNITARCVTEP